MMKQNKDEIIKELLNACRLAHQTIVRLAYLAADIVEDTGDDVANEPFGDGENGYAYQTNRILEKVILKTE